MPEDKIKEDRIKKENREYELNVSFQEDNKEARGEPDNLTKERNVSNFQARFPPKGRNKY